MTADPFEQERKQLLAIKAIAERAMSDDISLLRDYLATDFSIVTFSSRSFNDVEVFIREWNKSREIYLQGGTFKVEIEHQPAQFFGDIAVCHGNSTNWLTTGKGQVHQFASPWTAVLRKHDGQWRIIRAHSSIDPFNNSMVRATFAKMISWSIACAAIVGLVLGWAITRLIG